MPRAIRRSPAGRGRRRRFPLRSSAPRTVPARPSMLLRMNWSILPGWDGMRNRERDPPAVNDPRSPPLLTTPETPEFPLISKARGQVRRERVEEGLGREPAPLGRFKLAMEGPGQILRHLAALDRRHA